MGRLPALVGAVLDLLLLFGCESPERKGVFTTRERSQAIQTTAGVPEAGSGLATASANVRAVVKPPRTLCAGGLQDPKRLPKKPLSQTSAHRDSEVVPELKPNNVGFTWINFWAAWCAPCKEEIPRLRNWERRLATADPPLAVVFVSLDDDARQLQAFLESSPELRTTYWLREGRERDEWMAAAGLSPDPELPVHLLSDAQGKIRCTVQGAVEDADYPEVTRLLRH